MNNTFNTYRFGLLLKRQWLEFGKIYLITLGVALGVIITFYSFALWDAFTEKTFFPHMLNFREPLFLAFGFLFVTVIASSYFAHLGQKPKAIIDLMIPASTFEKLLTGILFTAFLSVISFALIFYFTDLAFVAKLRSMYNNVATETYNVQAGGKVTKTIEEIPYFFTRYAVRLFVPLYLVIPAFVTSVFLLGSIYFNKFHYIKTAISVMIFSGIWTFIIVKLAEKLFEGKIMIHEAGRNDMSENTGIWLISLLGLLLTIIFWSLTYIRLKEKEV